MDPLRSQRDSLTETGEKGKSMNRRFLRTVGVLSLLAWNGFAGEIVWKNMNWGPYGNGTLEMRPDGVLSILDRRTDGGAGISRALPLKGGEQLVLRVQVRGTQAKNCPFILQLNFAPGNQVVQKRWEIPFQRWEQPILEATAPAGSTGVTAYAYTGNPDVGAFEVRDAELQVLAGEALRQWQQQHAIVWGDEPVWQVYGDGVTRRLPGTGPARVLLDDRVSHSGAGIRQEKPAVAGQLWTLSAKVKGLKSENDPILLQLRFEPGGQLTQQEFTVQPDDGEKTLPLAAQAPAGTTSVVCHIYTANAAMPRYEVTAALLQEREKIAFHPEHIVPLRRELSLTSENTVLIEPADGSGAAAAALIRKTLEFPVKSVQDPEQAKAYSCRILLGNRNLNPEISRLYDRYYTLLDRQFPGENGWDARTLFDPAGDGIDFVTIGGNDAEAMLRAAEAFAARVKRAENGEVRVPFFWATRLDPRYRLPADYFYADSYDQSDGYGTRYFGWSVLSRLLALFYMTGDETYAREFMRLAFPETPEALKRLAQDPVAFRDHKDPIGTTYHYNAVMLPLYWNLVEHHPFFGNGRREQVIAALFREYEFFRDDHGNGCGIYQTVAPTDRVGNRHEQWAALTLYALARYLEKTLPPEQKDFQSARQAVRYHYASIHRYCWIEGEGGNLTWFPTGIETLPFYMLLTGDVSEQALRTLRAAYDQLLALAGNERKDRIVRYIPLSFLRRTAYLLQDSMPLDMERIMAPMLPPRLFRLGQSFEPAPGEYTQHTRTPEGVWRFLRPGPEEFHEWPAGTVKQEEAFAIAGFGEGGDRIILDGFLEQELRQPLHCLALFTLTLNRLPFIAGYRTQLWVREDGIARSALPRVARLIRADTLGGTTRFTGSLDVAKSAVWERDLIRRRGFALISDTLRENAGRRRYGLDFVYETGPGVERRTVADRPGTVEVAMEQENPDDYALYLAPDHPARTKPDNLELIRLVNDRALLFKATAAGQRLELPFTLKQPVAGRAVLRLYRYTDRGLLRVMLDDRVLADRLDGRGDTAEDQVVELGRCELPAGEHTLVLESLGSSGENPGACSIALVSFGITDRPVRRQMGSIHFVDSESKMPELRDESGDDLDRITGKTVVWRREAELEQNREGRYYTFFSPYPAAETMARRLGPGAGCCRFGKRSVLWADGDFEAVGFSGKKLFWGDDFLYAEALIRLQDWLRSDRPVDLDWNLESGDLTVRSAVPAPLSVAGRPYSIGAGKTVLRPEVPDSARRVAEMMAPLPTWRAPGIADADGSDGDLPVPAVRETRETEAYPAAATGFEYRGRRWTALASGRNIFIFDDAGKLVKTWTADATVGVLHFVGARGMLLAGCGDEQVIAFDWESGRRLWTHRSEMDKAMEVNGAVWYYKSSHPGVFGLNSGSLGGEELIFVGSASTLEVLDLDGRKQSSQVVYYGPVWQIAFFRNGAGIPLVGVAQLYPGYEYLTVFDRDYRRKLGYNVPPPGAEHFNLWACLNRTGIIVADLDGDGKNEIISGINGFWNRIIIWDCDGVPQREVSFGPGYAIRVPPYGKWRLERRMLADVKLLRTASGPRFAAGLEDGVMLLDRDLKKLWRRIPPSAVWCLAVSGERIAAGCADGSVILYDLEGKTVARGKLPAGVVQLEFAAPDVLLAADRNGRLEVWELTGEKAL